MLELVSIVEFSSTTNSNVPSVVVGQWMVEIFVKNFRIQNLSYIKHQEKLHLLVKLVILELIACLSFDHTQPYTEQNLFKK